MSILDRIRLIPRSRLSDGRGWFLKFMDGTGPTALPGQGEIYAVMAVPGQTRGSHFHSLAREWFCLLRGRAEVSLADPLTGRTLAFCLDAARPVTLAVPPGVAHAFTNPGESREDMILLACTDRPFDPADTRPFPFPDGPA